MIMQLLAHQASPQWNARVVLFFAGLWVGWVGIDRLRGTGFHRLPRWGGFTVLGVGGGLLVVAAAVPLLLNTPTTSLIRPPSAARLTIMEPGSGEVISGDTFPIEIELEGATVIDATSTDLRPDTGHIHVSLDGRVLSMTYGVDETFDASGLAPGPHVVEVEFVAADHLPFEPRVIERVAFEKGGAT
jgi:hypothetical protein